MTTIDPSVFSGPSLEAQLAAVGAALDAGRWGEASRLNAAITDGRGRAFRVVGPVDAAGNMPEALVGFERPEMTQAARGCNPPDGPHGLARFAADQPHRNPSAEGSTSHELCS